MTVEEMSGPPFGVFSDNWLAARVFCELDGQWRFGFHGPYALDYNVLYHKLDRMRLDPDEYDDIEASVRVMERAALRKMGEKR